MQHTLKTNFFRRGGPLSQLPLSPSMIDSRDELKPYNLSLQVRMLPLQRSRFCPCLADLSQDRGGVVLGARLSRHARGRLL